MNGALLLAGVCIYFGLAYLFYGRFLKKQFGVDNNQATPAHTMEDGIDYCPAPAAVLFGHHFASIAGAGPIVGPVLAAACGYLPALLWIIIGCVFIGAMHDFAALFLSVRNQGRSIAYVIEKEVGYLGRQMFLLFCIFGLILLVSVFTNMVADSFISNPAVATTSLLFIAMAPAFGVLTNKKLLSLTQATCIFVPMLFFFVWLGTIIPLDLTAIFGCSVQTARVVWAVLLLIYAFSASVIPVWILLQPRDYLNSYLLYTMMALGFVSIFCAHPALNMPAVYLPNQKLVPKIFPLLFVTVACGACSGFHATVASGTTSKQLNQEKELFTIGYGGMLVEGILAVIALISVTYLGKDQLLALLTGPDKVPPAIAFARGLAHFSTSLGIPESLAENFITLSVSAFLLTSLDTATRLARFTFQEFILPSTAPADSAENNAPATQMTENPPAPNWLRKYLGSTFLSTLFIILFSALFIFSGYGMSLWPVFGSANQLLAALTLLCVTLWLLRHKKPMLFAFLPMLFMMVISVSSLVMLFREKWHSNPLLTITSGILLLLALVLILLSIGKFRSSFSQRKP